jgi:hypothetical protein
MSPPAHRPNRAWLLLPAGLSLLAGLDVAHHLHPRELGGRARHHRVDVGWARPMRWLWRAQIVSVIRQGCLQPFGQHHPWIAGHGLTR